MKIPAIGITVDNHDNTATSGRYESSIAYSRCVAQAGGLPVLLPHEPQRVGQYASLCDGFVLTGGVDPKTEAFGQPTHPQARPMDERRQAFELALLTATDEHPSKPVLGICLGMQLMALRAGGTLHQHLPDILNNPQLHENDNRHAITLCETASAMVDQPLIQIPIHSRASSGVKSPTPSRSRLAVDAHGLNGIRMTSEQATVVSWHRQAVAPGPSEGFVGRLRVLAVAPDGVIEAIDDPQRAFYLGVQWHPERGGPGPLNQGLFDRFVAVAASDSPTTQPTSR